jgi:hypothetical protein
MLKNGRFGLVRRRKKAEASGGKRRTFVVVYTIRNSSGLPSSVSLTGLPMLLIYSFL